MNEQGYSPWREKGNKRLWRTQFDFFSLNYPRRECLSEDK